MKLPGKVPWGDSPGEDSRELEYEVCDGGVGGRGGRGGAAAYELDGLTGGRAR